MSKYDYEYNIIYQYDTNCAEENIDGDDNYQEAIRLLNEYRMAYMNQYFYALYVVNSNGDEII